MFRDMKKEPGEDGDADRYVMSRKEDRSLWIRSAYFIEKYKLLWVVMTAVAAAFGWQYISPNERFALLAQNQLLARTRMDTVSLDLADIKRTLRILVVMQCLDRTDEQLALMQLDCRDVIRYRQKVQKK